jgi:nudix-type nucleoside diphosphatase (YffH/AdpP family)
MDSLQEEITASKAVFQGNLLQVKVEEVLLPDGTRSRREVVYHPGAVAIVPLTAQGEVILVRQFRLPAGKALLEIPAGVLKAQESAEVCAARELAEEIGKGAGKWRKLAACYLAPGYSSEIIHLFLAEELSDAPGTADFDERLEVVVLPFAEALARIDRGEINDGKTIAGLLLANRRLPLER